MSVLIAISQQSDIPLPASLSNQLYEKVIPLEAFVWEGRTPEDIAAVKNAIIDLRLQLPSLKGIDAWFGTALVNCVFVGGEGVQFVISRLPGQKGRSIQLAITLECQLQPDDGHLAYLKRINIGPEGASKVGSRSWQPSNHSLHGACGERPPHMRSYWRSSP